MPVEIKVFPDTGHQYFTFPLDQLCKKNAGDLRTLVVRNLDKPWAVWPEYAWIRYKYEMLSSAGSLSLDTPAIHLAIATHMSVPEKALLYECQSGLEQGGEDDENFPYACDSAAALPDTLGDPAVVKLYNLPDPSSSGGPERRLDDVSVRFMRNAAGEPVDVDLVVDLGNTRTAALLVESRAAGEAGSFPFERRVKPLRFFPPGVAPERLRKDQGIIPSWFLVQRTTFAPLEPPLSLSQLVDRYRKYTDVDGNERFRRMRFYPRAFLELAPIRIGGGNDSRGCASLWATAPYGYSYAWSSPKRYVWDDTPVGGQGQPFWQQLKSTEDPDRQSSRSTEHPLDGLIRMYMDPQGNDWDIDASPDETDVTARFHGQPPSYPRRDSICWFALAVLENAARQINSQDHILSTGKPGVPRRLRNIMVTYPAAWNQAVKQAYFDQWKRAINLFTVTHFDAEQHLSVKEGGRRPEFVDENINEAICSQIPVLYSDIGTLMKLPEQWIQLYGAEDSVVVMNLDIGGGTTDLTVIRYAYDGQKKQLNPHLTFQDGRSIAGDMLVKKIIEKLVIPAWLKSSEIKLADVPESVHLICSLFADPANQRFSDVEPQAAEKMVRITRLVFIPIVNALLSRVGEQDGKPSAFIDLSVNPGAGAGHNEGDVFVFHNPLGHLNQMLDRVVQQLCPAEYGYWRKETFRTADVTLRFSTAEVDQAIEEVFGKFVRSFSGVVNRSGCHLVVVTGKPSELPKLREIINESFQLLPQRIIYAKNFPAGQWYPFGRPGTRPEEIGRISDAKTCTVVGAAVYLDSIRNNHLTSSMFSIARNAGELQGGYYWGVVSGQGDGDDFFSQQNLLFGPNDYHHAREDAAGRKTLVGEPRSLIVGQCRVGRHLESDPALRPDQPEMVYELCFQALPGRQIGVIPPTEALVTLRWVLDPKLGESVELVSCELIAPGGACADAQVRLRINTMLENSYWLDDPKFHCDHEALLR